MNNFISVDPSSTAIGFALWKNGKVYHHGIFVRRSAQRIETFCVRSANELLARRGELVASGQVPFFLLEIPSGRVNARRNKGCGSGLSTYGYAVGIVYATLAAFGATVHTVDESWAGSHSKDKRKRAAERLGCGYDPANDPGGDAADALCLGHMAPLLAKRDRTLADLLGILHE